MFRLHDSQALMVTLVIGLTSGLPTAWARPDPIKEGRAHPQFVLPTIDGDQAVALSGFRGKKVLLVHFASWCAESRRDVPLWHKMTKPSIDDEKLVVLGIAHEQHADRCQLFAQWKGIDWPILHDPLNLVDVAAVPFLVAVDEHGIVRDTKLDLQTFGKSFVSGKFAAPDKPVETGSATLPVPKEKRGYAHEARTPQGWLDYGDAVVLAGRKGQIDQAIDAYHWARKLAMQRTPNLGPEHADIFFRLGVAYHMRCERPEHQPGDFQAAVDAWEKALALRPDNEIFKRRIQQYGPRVDKPYAFYDWVKTARMELAKREETPVELACEPSVSERSPPADKFKWSKKKGPKGDPDEKIKDDRKDLIVVTQAVVRGTDKKNRNVAQVHLTFRPNAEFDAHWDNASDPLRLWIRKPKTGRVSRRFVEYSHAMEARSSEARTLNFEVKLPSQQKGTLTIKGYALYRACEGEDGKCRLLRQDVKVKIKL